MLNVGKYAIYDEMDTPAGLFVREQVRSAETTQKWDTVGYTTTAPVFDTSAQTWQIKVRMEAGETPNIIEQLLKTANIALISDPSISGGNGVAINVLYANLESLTADPPSWIVDFVIAPGISLAILPAGTRVLAYRDFAVFSGTAVWAKAWANDNPFKSGTYYRYKCSYMYDGYQESPLEDLAIETGGYYRQMNLAEIHEAFGGTNMGEILDRTGGQHPLIWEKAEAAVSDGVWGGGLAELPFKFHVKNTASGLHSWQGNRPHPRVTAVNVYRGRVVDGHVIEYELAKQFDITTGSPITPWDDIGDVGQSYLRRTGISETIESMDVRYKVNADIKGYHVVSGVFVRGLGFEQSLLLRSGFQRFGVFDYLNHFARTKGPVVALAEYRGYLMAFERGHSYLVDVDRMTVIEEYAGQGCLSPLSLQTTDRGLFFASEKNFYVSSGGAANPIGKQTWRNAEVSPAGYSKRAAGTPTVVLYHSSMDAVFFLFQSGSEIRGWLWDTQSQSWLTSLNYGARVLRGGFTDHKGNAWLLTNEGLQNLSLEAQGRKAWTLHTNRIHLNGEKFYIYELRIQFNKLPDMTAGAEQLRVSGAASKPFFEASWKYDGQAAWTALAVRQPTAFDAGTNTAVYPLKAVGANGKVTTIRGCQFRLEMAKVLASDVAADKSRRVDDISVTIRRLGRHSAAIGATA